MEHIETYNDNKLTFNQDTGFYELDMGFVKQEFGNPFTDDGVLRVRIKRNSLKVYNYIFSHAYSGNRKVIQAIINHTNEYRKYVFDALYSQMMADLASGYNDQALFTPQNKDERDMQFLNEVSVSTENILENSKGYGGINLLYAGVFYPNVYLEFMNYIK